MPLQATSGAASYDAFGGGVPVVPNYIEDVFSTWLYTGNDSSQTITNGIDLAGKGGLVWIKSRNQTYSHILSDTNRGTGKFLSSNTSDAQGTDAQDVSAFNAAGFTVGNNSRVNNSSFNYVAWTFREQPKFFDVVTWTGSGVARNISHNLGSVPGCILVKSVNLTSDWVVYHRSLPNTDFLYLNTTQATGEVPDYWNDTTPTSTTFRVNTNSAVNGDGQEYVAYVFAHNAGGFGLTGTDNVISCGSVVGASQVEVNLGYEPQWILVKNASAAQDWWVVDNMRGLPVQATDTSYNASALRPNLSDAETTGFSIAPSATGFKANVLTSSQTYIYIAIRRGPMAVPTDGTSVYGAVSRTGTDANATISSLSFPPDTLITKNRSGTASPIGAGWLDRLRGLNNFLTPSATSAEDTAQTDILRSWNMNGATLGPDANTSRFNWSGNTYINWFFGRAPGFFDEVCYTGTGANLAVTHNLGVAPEMMIVKRRDTGGYNWNVYLSTLGASSGLWLNDTTGELTGVVYWNSTSPTSSVFSIGSNVQVNASGGTYVAYLFGTVAGVSKVGSYTGNGSSQTINCGFTGGARFVMVKATSTTGNWIVADSARGIVAGNDPALYLNSTAAEVTGFDWIDADNSGFIVNETATIAANTNGVSYIFLAIA